MDVSEQSRRGHRRYGFLCRPDRDFSIALRLVLLRHERRKIVHFNISATPTAEWTAQQVIYAFPDDTAPQYLVRDRDSIYGLGFVRRVKGMGIEQKLIARRSPWQSPYVERLIGSIRHECLDRLIVLNQAHLRQLLDRYVQYYHDVRPHRALGHDSPVPRSVQLPDAGKVISIPILGGLQHHYLRQAA